MYGRLDWIKKAGMMTLAIITIITIASAAPLEISIEEKINTTVNPTDIGTDGAVIFSYITNVTGYVNITNTGSDPIYDIWIALNLTNITTGSCSLYKNSSYVNVSNSASGFVPDKINKSGVFDTSNANCFIHIPLLKQNEIVSVFYDVNDSSMGIADGAPFDISEKYNPWKIPAGVNFAWTVYFNVSLNETWWQKTALDLSGKNVLLNITKYLSNNSTHFGSPNWVTLGPISNQRNESGAQPQSVNFFNSQYTNYAPDTGMNLTGIQLDTTSRYCNVSFWVTGNNTNSTATHSLEPFGFAVFNFSVVGNISGSYVVDVFAVGNASINVTKSGPNETSYWFGNASITNTASGLTYILTNVTMWATPQLDFNTVISDSMRDWKPREELPPGGSWNTSSATPAGISFYYNDVPIIWANATFKLIQSSTHGWGTNITTLHDYNATYGSNFIVIEKIYIIGTYLIKVTKHVMFNESASGTDKSVFDIYLVVENIGGNYSPYVYVYDLIPQNFSEYNWDDAWDDVGDGNWVNKSSMLEGNYTVDFGSNPLFGTYSKGYYWRLKPLNYTADGDGSYQDWDEIENNQTVVIFYQLNGTGDFKVLDTFIVGIDPMYSLNEQTSPKITLVGGAKATNYESTLAAIVFAATGTIALIARRNGRKR